MNRFNPARTALALLAAACLLPAALAQTYPTKPIRVIVPFPPGGVDVTMRLLQKVMTDELGQPLVLENRAGANGYIGSELVARSVPDGYTLLATSVALVAGPAVTRAPFDPLKDFTPITQVFGSVSIVVVKPALPLKSIPELIDFAKRNPGKLSYASSGIGSAQHIDAEVFKLLAGIDMLHVPYKGGGPQMQAIVSGEVDLSFFPLQQIRPHLVSGKARMIATYDGKRYAGFPDTPDITEAVPEFRKYKAQGWSGLLGPANLPRPIVQRLHAAAVKAINAPEVRPKIADNSEVVGNTPEEFAAKMRSDVDSFNNAVAAVKARGIALE